MNIDNGSWHKKRSKIQFNSTFDDKKNYSFVYTGIDANVIVHFFLFFLMVIILLCCIVNVFYSSNSVHFLQLVEVNSYYGTSYVVFVQIERG